MRSGFALVLAPCTALAVQTALYALVLPSCGSQTRWMLHAAAAAALLFTLLLGVLAASDWRRHAEHRSVDLDAGDVRSSRRFLAILGTAASALSALVIAAMWLGVWVLSPCLPWP